MCVLPRLCSAFFFLEKTTPFLSLLFVLLLWMMQSPCVSTLHEFVEKHVVQESTEALDVAQLAELEATVPPVSALLPDDVDQLASDSLQVWNRAVKQGEKDGVQQQLQSLSTGVFLKHFFFLHFHRTC